MKKMCFFLLLFISAQGFSQVVLTNTQPTQLLDFSANMPPTAGTAVGSAFSSAGFEPGPVIAGRLNSNAFSISGWSDGSLNFGGVRITSSTDYTRGATANPVSTGGIYAFTGSPASASDPMFLIQPGGGDWAPGNMILRIKNGSTVVIQSISVQYDLYVRNDQGRSSSLVFSHSADGVNFSSIPLLDYISPVAADAAGMVHVDGNPSRSTVIIGLMLAPGDLYYLRWSGEDIGGSGARDEFGIDNILINADFAQSPLPVTLLDLKANPEKEMNRISWKTVFEQNNLGFEVQRSADGINFKMMDFVATKAPLGNSQDILLYNLLDDQVRGNTWFYRLKQVDIDGRSCYSTVITCRRNPSSVFQLNKVFPVPFEANLNIECYASRSMKVIFRMYNLTGRLLKEKEFEIMSGTNRISIEEINSKGPCCMFFYSTDGSLLEKRWLIGK